MLLGYVTKNRTRYIASITVQKSQVNFIGQSVISVAYTEEELRNLLIMPDPLAALIMADSLAQPTAGPTAPYRLEYSNLTLGGPFGTYLVLRYAGLMYYGEKINF